MNLKERIQDGWNAFMGRDPTRNMPMTYGYADTFRTSHVMVSRGNERSQVTAILNRIAVDVASITIEHAQLDEDKRYKEPRTSMLNECLTMAANSDQTARAFLQDCAMSLMDEGVIAIVPTSATANPMYTSSYDIGALRVGKVTQWYPQHVTVELYNEITGRREERTFPKHMVALPENPFYAIMNEPNSIYQRLLEKLRQLDTLDSQSASGKLDLIIQVPYTTRSATHKALAEDRISSVESQLAHSKYGVAYIDGTEKVVQLNRAVENNLFTQVDYYTKMLYSQLGMPPSVFDGTADEATMLNYQTRTIEPIVSAIIDSMKWKFLTKTARTQGQSIVFFKDPFKLCPVDKIADIADKFTRNEILSSNEVRQIVGFKPSDQEGADDLRNKNLNQQISELPQSTEEEEPDEAYLQQSLEDINEFDKLLDEMDGELDDDKG